MATQAAHKSKRESRGSFRFFELPMGQTLDTERQDAEELKARLTTNEGLTTYTDYVGHLANDYQGLDRLCYYLDCHAGSPVYTTTQHCSIFDVIDAESEEIVTCKFESNSPCALDVLEALHDTSTQVSLRIIIWHLDRDWKGMGITDTLGICLRLDSRFFSALFAKISPEKFLRTELHHLYAEHVVIGNYIVTFGNLDTPQGPSIPYLLIANCSSESYWPERVTPFNTNQMPRYDLFQDICPRPLPVSTNALQQKSSKESLERVSRESEPNSEDDDLPNKVNERNRLYVDILRRTLNRLDETKLDGDSILLSSLFPLFQLSALKARDWVRGMRPKMDDFPTITGNDSLINLRLERSVLRRWIERTEEDMDHLHRYIRLRHKHVWLKHPIWQMLEEESNQSLAQARRIEAQARDYLQVEFGSAALEETKKSIQLSSSQIAESRRVKIFTVLAFIYIPLNLATSIFGMNLQQLNNNGRPLYVFFITAILALVSTGIVWFCIDQYNGFMNWKTDERQYGVKTCTKFNLTSRLAMLGWLVRHRHVSWMRQSGVWPLILKGSVREPSGYPMDLPDEAWHLSAPEYVSKYMLWSRSRDGFDAFAINPVPIAWEKE